MDTTNNQAEKLALAQKTIYEQKIKIMELEEKNQKAELEKIKSKNQTLLNSMACQQDLIERLKTENKGLKLQNQKLELYGHGYLGLGIMLCIIAALK